jgi:hypothetical protein
MFTSNNFMLTLFPVNVDNIEIYIAVLFQSKNEWKPIMMMNVICMLLNERSLNYNKHHLYINHSLVLLFYL